VANITAIIPKVAVPDLDSAIPFYEKLTGAKLGERFSHGTVSVAWVGNFLLVAGTPNNRPAQPALILVQSLDEVFERIQFAGGQILEGPDTVPNGRRAVLRHPDGIEFEYLETSLVV
jgi:predicted enzyme related to lactoylglutathione lyase